MRLHPVHLRRSTDGPPGRTGPLLLATCALGWVGAGCGAPEPGKHVTVADSAGIRIVENGSVARHAAPFQLAPEPLFRIGWQEGEHAFGRIVGGAILSDGTIVVADQMAREAIVLSPRGEVLDTIGGPGQFRALSRMATLGGDTLVFQDGLGSVSLFHRETFLKRIPPDRATFDLRMLGSDGRTRIFFGPPRVLEPFPSGEPDRWISLDIPAVDARTGAVETFTTVDFALQTSGNPLAPQAAVAVTGGQVVVARQDRTEVRWLDSTGQVTQIARWAMPRVMPSDSLWAAVTEEYRSQREAIMRLTGGAAGVPGPRFSRGPLPYFGKVLGDSCGRVGLAEYLPPRSDPPTRYFVIAPDGEWLVSVAIPERFEILAITDEYVTGTHRNAFDVDAVSVYRVIAATGRSGEPDGCARGVL